MAQSKLFTEDYYSMLSEYLGQRYNNKMGGWKLEVAKMALYMAFPVTLFHIFNQAELFEDWVTSIRRELYPPENKMHREEIRECIRKMREKDDKVLLQLLEEEKKKTLI